MRGRAAAAPGASLPPLPRPASRPIPARPPAASAGMPGGPRPARHRMPGRTGSLTARVMSLVTRPLSPISWTGSPSWRTCASGPWPISTTCASAAPPRLPGPQAETRAAVAREWLPVVDNLERALAASTADPAAIIDGIRAVREQALHVLARLGYPRRDDLGTTFDPTRHDAVAARADPAAADGSVVEVLQPAYGEGDHQLRPAQVVVARPG